MRVKWIGPVAVSSLIIFLFFGFKILRFKGLYYTFNDMYIFLQASCSWMSGRPVLYENIWGYDDRIHNNYAMLLWGPFIYVWGAYGAFAVQAVLTLLGYSLVLTYCRNRMATWAVWLMLIVLLVGPVWFWLYDHPGIGWHPELTYFPLSLLFICSLLTARTGWFWLVAGLIVLVKEDGALLAGAIHLAVLSLTYLANDRNKTIWDVLRQPRFWWVASGWALVFVAGMAFLSYKNHAAEPEPRLQQALHAIGKGLQDKAFIKRNLKLFFMVFLLLLPSLAVLLYGLKRIKWRQVGSILLIYSVAQLAILFSNWVQGATYYGTNEFFDFVSLTWPPRFVLVYAFSTAFILTVWLLFKADETNPAGWQKVTIPLILFFIQLPIIELARPDFRLFSILSNIVRYPYDPNKEFLLPEADVTVIKKLAQVIPPRSNVFIFDFLIPFYHKHFNIWPTEKQWEDADLAIIPKKDFQNLSSHLNRVMKQPYRAIQLTAYTIYVTPAYEPYVNASIANETTVP